MGWLEKVESAARRLGLRKAITRLFYQESGVILRDGSVTFLNFGYAPLAEEDLDAGPERYCRSLYRHVTAAVDLTGTQVLEVGCGRGGGAAFVMSQLGPAAVVGLDFAPNNIAHCRVLHRLPGLTFVVGDAEDLPFPDATFDVVLNVESSCLYGCMKAFLDGVRRVLRPGGCFLFADLRPSRDIPALEEALLAAGFLLVSRNDITANVARALEEDNGRRTAEIARRVPPLFRNLAKEVAGTEGSSLLSELSDGSRRYISCVLRRTATPSS